MLRFVPDSWAEGLLRPLFMAEPVAGLYLEDAAPDWRFAAFIVLAGTLLLVRKRVQPAPTLQQTVTGLGLVLLLYVWTFVVGNGRYFAWALLLIGPLMVAACALLPLSRSMRWALILLLLAVQGVSVYLARTPNHWALVRLGDDSPPALAPSPLRERPAVFLTVSNLSYSALVPLFHPQSRWASIAGQYNIVPGRPEWPRLQALLASGLPHYLLVAVRPQDHDAEGQPHGPALHAMQTLVGQVGLRLAPRGCSTLWSVLSGPGALETAAERGKRGFWICKLDDAPHSAGPAPSAFAPDSVEARALDRVEQACPRFFPSGRARVVPIEGVLLRNYDATDTRLWTQPGGFVMFQYFRSPNPTVLGTNEAVVAGRFTVPCQKLPGRFVPFWQRD